MNVEINIRDKMYRATDGGAMPVADLVGRSWAAIAPFWPLENLIAVNPLRGLEDRPIEDALRQAEAWFEQPDLPVEMTAVNRGCIKWLQAFFDEGQATIAMPMRDRGLFAAWKALAVHDPELVGRDADQTTWLAGLPDDPLAAIAIALERLSVAAEERETFLTLLLVSLPGWAAFVQYRTGWTGHHPAPRHPVTKADFLAMRIVAFCLWGARPATLLQWHAHALQAANDPSARIDAMEGLEVPFRQSLLETLQEQALAAPGVPEAQLVFCIDVRSEPFRRALEQLGRYETFGFAGFFGVPVAIEDKVTGESYASCPVLLHPAHRVVEGPCGSAHAEAEVARGTERLATLKKLYQSVKYTFTTPFMLVETLGLASGAWMGLRNLSPLLATATQRRAVNAIRPDVARAPSIETIPFAEQCAYAEGALRAMGLTTNFAPLIVLCGHGSTTQNNAYASALDCGACGGRHGAPNARILATILNDPVVRGALAERGIFIPNGTVAIAAEHDTTTDRVELYAGQYHPGLDALRRDLEEAGRRNSAWRSARMDGAVDAETAARSTLIRSQDWAQVRPEWGLARNAAFLVAPRSLSASVDLEGRCFLHSYDHAQDPDGAALEVILTAPMVVAQWINSQYLFSTLDNVAYGGGSKITKNVTGKIGIMQGNASDLMTGLPLQSVFADDDTPYHAPQRLQTIVYAPRVSIDRIIAKHAILRTLFGNGWVGLSCIEPDTRRSFVLQRDLSWTAAD